MTRATLLLFGALMLALPAWGADNPGARPAASPKADLKTSIAGNTIAFIAHVVYPQPVSLGRGKGVASVGDLHAVAFLAPDGRARLKRWNAETGAYDPVVDAAWTVTEDALCLNAPWPSLRTDKFCMDLRVDGPMIAGHGIGISALVKGNIRPGNHEKL